MRTRRGTSKEIQRDFVEIRSPKTLAVKRIAVERIYLGQTPYGVAYRWIETDVAENSTVGWLVVVLLLVLVLESRPISTTRTTTGGSLGLTIGAVSDKTADLPLVCQNTYGKVNPLPFVCNCKIETDR